MVGKSLTVFSTLILVLLLIACRSTALTATHPVTTYLPELEQPADLPATLTPKGDSGDPPGFAAKVDSGSSVGAPAAISAAANTFTGWSPPSPPAMNPLTGMFVSDPALLARRPVMVKVSNFPPSGRPQAGLSFADLVFEYYIGEWTNRFVAVYYGQDAPKVGPIRSGRLVDAQLARLYGGLLAYGNADPRVEQVLVEQLGNRAIAFKDVPCPPICGNDTHSVTGVFADTTELSLYANEKHFDNQQPSLNGMIFDPEPPPQDDFAVQIEVKYIKWNRGEWHYDPASGMYLRWIESWEHGNQYPLIPHLDRLSGQQLAFANLILLFADYVEYNPTLHDIKLWDNTGGKRAVFYRNGLMFEGSWQTMDSDRPLLFLQKNGLPMPLKPGNSWIVLADPYSGFKQAKPGQWQLYFDLPEKAPEDSD